MRNLGKWISIIARNSQIYYKRSFEKLGISGGQYIFLICICENEGRTQEWLAEELSMNKSTVARVVAALEQIGMVERLSLIHILYCIEQYFFYEKRGKPFRGSAYDLLVLHPLYYR